MFHFTIFGGSEVNLRYGGQFVLTIFGGTTVRKPTLAKRLMQEKHRLTHRGASPALARDRVLQFLDRDGGIHRGRMTFLLTMFGGVNIKPPSLAEEFMDMRELVSSGLIGEAEWDQLIGRLYQMGELDSISSFTLFGGMGEEQLNEEEEIRKIRSACELGLISREEEQALRSVVGRDPEQVRMLLRQTAFA